MALDPNIILGVKPVQFDNPMDMATKAMTMKQLSMQTQAQERSLADEQSMRDAYKSSQTLGQDGSNTLDKKMYLSQLAGKIGPQKAAALSQQLDDADLEKQKYLTETHNTLAMKVPTDPNIPLAQKQAIYSSARAEGIQKGVLDPNEFPEQYPGDKMMQSIQFHTNTQKEQAEQLAKTRGLNIEQQRANAMDGGKEEKASEKDAADLEKHLSQGWSGRSGQSGQVQAKINNAEYAQGLLDQAKLQKGGADSRQIEELAQSYARLLGGNAAASARVEALVPHTFWGNAQSMKEYLSNSPTGSGQEEFVKRIEEGIQREKAIAEKQKRSFQVEGLARFAKMKKKDPETYGAILRSKGIDDSMIDENGRYKAPDKKDSGPGQTFKTNEIEW